MSNKLNFPALWVASAIVQFLLVPLSNASVDTDMATPLSVAIDETVLYDSNPFRLETGATPPGQSSSEDRDDWSSSTRIKMQYTYKEEGQLLQLDAAPGIVRYQRFSQLDHQQEHLAMRWEALLQERSKITTTFAYSRLPSAIADQKKPAPNLITTNTFGTTLVLGTNAKWQTRFGATATILHNSEPTFSDANRAGWTAETGIRASSREGNSLDLSYRFERQRYPDRITSSIAANRYKQNSITNAFNWAASASSRLSGQVSYQIRKHDTFPQRNFKGWSGNIDYTLVPNGIGSISVTAFRLIGEVTDASASYARTNGVQLSYRWKASEKTEVVPQITWRERDYKGFSTLNRPIERTTRLSLSANYTLSPTTVLEAGVGRESRRSENASSRYSTTFASARIVWRFH